MSKRPRPQPDEEDLNRLRKRFLTAQQQQDIIKERRRILLEQERRKQRQLESQMRKLERLKKRQAESKRQAERKRAEKKRQHDARVAGCLDQASELLEGLVETFTEKSQAVLREGKRTFDLIPKILFGSVFRFGHQYPEEPEDYPFLQEAAVELFKRNFQKELELWKLKLCVSWEGSDTRDCIPVGRRTFTCVCVWQGDIARLPPSKQGRSQFLGEHHEGW